MQVGAAGAPPVTAAEFAERLAALGAPRYAIVAVSGGPDSMALMRVASASGAKILAVTVDHGLRAGSRAEAEQAASWCGAVGVEHRILHWDGAKPATGVQAAARTARYRLLATLADREGCEAILTGHTADDQAETVFMRLARGSGPFGLAGMEADTLIAAGAGAPVRLLRPLLEFSRKRILATLAAFCQQWIDDPSNDDPSYERTRTRALLAALEEQSLLTREALVRTAARARLAVRRIEAADEDAFRQAGGEFNDLGWVVLAANERLPATLIARLIRAVSGEDFAPAEEDANAALAVAVERGVATLGGAMLKRHRGKLFIFREPAALLGRACVAPIEPATIEAGGNLLWDNRFIVENRSSSAVTVAPLGERDVAETGRLAAELAAPIESLKASPWIIASGDLKSAEEAAIRCLIEERFFGRVMRFP